MKLIQMKLRQVIYLLLLLTGLSSCGSSSKEDTSKDSDEFKEAEESLKNQIEDVVYNIPSPSEIPYLLEATGAEFNPGLLNPRSKVDQYVTRTDKAALNLGVYAADIGYLSSYDKTQEAIDYLNSCKMLADNLNVLGSFDIEVLKRFEANISNKDSLARLLDETIHNTQDFLRDDDRNKLAAQVITGSFIEGLYISTGLIKSFPKDLLPAEERNLILTPLIQVVLQQEKSVSELLKMLNSVEQSGSVATIVSDLKELDKTYQALDIEDKIHNNQANLVLSDKNLVEITAIVARIRQHVTE